MLCRLSFSSPSGLPLLVNLARLPSQVIPPFSGKKALSEEEKKFSKTQLKKFEARRSVLA